MFSSRGGGLGATMTDYDVARHWFGLLVTDTGFYQVVGALALFLVLLASVKRWGLGLGRGGR